MTAAAIYTAVTKQIAVIRELLRLRNCSGITNTLSDIAQAQAIIAAYPVISCTRVGVHSGWANQPKDKTRQPFSRLSHQGIMFRSRRRTLSGTQSLE